MAAGEKESSKEKTDDQANVLDDHERMYIQRMDLKEPLPSEKEEALFHRICVLKKNILETMHRYGVVAELYIEEANSAIYARALADKQKPFDFNRLFSDTPTASDKAKFMEELLPQILETSKIQAQCLHVSQLYKQLYEAHHCESNMPAVREAFEMARQKLVSMYPQLDDTNNAINRFFERIKNINREVIKLLNKLAESPDNSQLQKSLEEYEMRLWMPIDEFRMNAKLIRQSIREVHEALKEITETNLYLVISIAQKYTNCGLAFLDLIQAGNEELMQAVKEFDGRSTEKFSDYADRRIRQAITRAIVEQVNDIGLPEHVRKEFYKVICEKKDLAQSLGHKPSVEEIATACGISQEKVAIALELMDIPIHANYNSPLDKAKDVLSTLNSRERAVIELRFGLKDGTPRTREEIGRQFNVTRERIRQIEAKFLRKMRHPTRIS